MPSVYDQTIAAQLQLRPAQIAATIELLDSGNTLPFIARYRKEITGNLDEEQIRALSESLERLRALDERRQSILDSLTTQGQLTPALQQQIEAAPTLTALEDLYQPYKPKRRTRASTAREKGLQGLADLILRQVRTVQTAAELAKSYLNDQVPDTESALAGACDIVAEIISDHAEVLGQVRERALRFGLLRCAKIETADDPKKVYETYYAFELRVDRVKPYQLLAINRGEAGHILRVSLDVAERDWQQPIRNLFRPDLRSPLAAQLEFAGDDAAHRLLLPAIERDVRRILTEQAEAHAIRIFATNLQGLLTQPPLANQTVLGIDPGFRSGCKVAVIDPTGKILDTATIYPHEPQRQRDAALRILQHLIDVHRVTLIAIGNGTASRETEEMAAELTRALPTLHYVMVNEAGASVYSASPLARAELPDLDVTLRGAVSIARRVQDPLAELVKIDPQSIGVGLYQHDVNQKQLAASLESVVESVVNRVGVDLNTASAALLTYVAGIGPKLAQNIVAYRDENGRFPDRKTLRKVTGLGPKAFEQAAGFLRVRGGDNPLDASAIHPESYPIATAILKRAAIKADAPSAVREAALATLRAQQPIDTLATALGTGMPTLTDILDQLVRPGRDPREALPAPLLRRDVLSMDDLQRGMRLSGTVRNVVDFGAFVDIGVKQDGLLHRSQIPRGELLTVGSVIQVEILNVESERGRISLGWPDAE
ncbi:MAG: Tex family protein [Aggregatilineales bacterium]